MMSKLRVRAAMPYEPWLRRVVLWVRKPTGEARIRWYCGACLRCPYTDATHGCVTCGSVYFTFRPD